MSEEARAILPEENATSEVKASLSQAPTQRTQEEPVVPEVRTVLLRDQGPRLPLGIPDTGGTLRTDLVCRPWTMKEEKRLGKLRDQNRNLTMFQYATMVLATMYERMGPFDFNDMKFDERRLRAGQMYMGDVYYAYVWLRIQAMDPVLKTELTCSACRSPFPFSANLETIEVITASALDPFLWSYELHTPLQIRSKEVRSLKMGPTLWHAMEKAGEGGMNLGTAKAGIILGSLVEVGSLGAVVLTETELDGMVKKDIERITDRLISHRLGPDMAMEGDCPHCRRPFKLPIDWGYDNFFDSSSP